MTREQLAAAAKHTPWSVERANERATGFRGVSIKDARGHHIANMVFQLGDENEVALAHLIVNAVNHL